LLSGSDCLRRFASRGGVLPDGRNPLSSVTETYGLPYAWRRACFGGLRPDRPAPGIPPGPNEQEDGHGVACVERVGDGGVQWLPLTRRGVRAGRGGGHAEGACRPRGPRGGRRRPPRAR